MKKLTAFLGALLLSALAAAGPFAISSGTPVPVTATTGTGNTMVLQSSPTLNTPTLSVPKLATQTWANLPAASGNAWATTVASDLGANGTMVVSNGTRWRPLSGETTLATLGTPITGITNTETVVCQTKLPVNSWQNNDSIRIYTTGSKTGTTDASQISVRIGTAGTTSDTALTGLSALIFTSAAGRTGGGIYEVKLLSSTSAQALGPLTSGSHTYQVASSSQTPIAATTITDASANALYVTLTEKSSGTTNTVEVDSCQIKLITP